MQGSLRNSLLELTADLRLYLLQEGISSVYGKEETFQLFSQVKRTVVPTPSFSTALQKAPSQLLLPPAKISSPPPQLPKPTPQKLLEPSKVQTPIVSPPFIEVEESSDSRQRPKSTPLLKKYLSENPSTLHFVEQVLDDREARKIRSQWLIQQMHVAVLVSKQGEEEERFIQSVAKAISDRLCTAYFPDRCLPLQYLSWEELLSGDSLKLILTTRAFLLSDPALRKGCSGISQAPLLFGKPLLILDPLTHYIGSPKQKSDLWEKVKGALQPVAAV